jgi:hypothetical protein
MFGLFDKTTQPKWRSVARDPYEIAAEKSQRSAKIKTARAKSSYGGGRAGWEAQRQREQFITGSGRDSWEERRKLSGMRPTGRGFNELSQQEKNNYEYEREVALDIQNPVEVFDYVPNEPDPIDNTTLLDKTQTQLAQEAGAVRLGQSEVTAQDRASGGKARFTANKRTGAQL